MRIEGHHQFMLVILFCFVCFFSRLRRQILRRAIQRLWFDGLPQWRLVLDCPWRPCPLLLLVRFCRSPLRRGIDWMRFVALRSRYLRRPDTRIPLFLPTRWNSLFPIWSLSPSAHTHGHKEFIKFTASVYMYGLGIQLTNWLVNDISLVLVLYCWNDTHQQSIQNALIAVLYYFLLSKFLFPAAAAAQRSIYNWIKRKKKNKTTKKKTG